MTHPIDSTILDGANVSKVGVRGYMKARVPVIATAAEVVTFNLAPQELILIGARSYLYDAADTSSAHSPPAVVVSLEGRRYKPASFQSPVSTTAGRLVRFANAAGAIEMTSSFFEDIATGRAGVGTTSPARAWHVASATGDTAVRIENTSGSVDLRLFGASLFIDQNINLGEIIFRFGPTYGQTLALNATTMRPGSDNTFDLGSASFRWRDGRFAGIVTTGVYTVATLPAGVTGALAYVTDANATTYNSVVAGGGSNRVRVSHDGTNWRIG